MKKKFEVTWEGQYNSPTEEDITRILLEGNFDEFAFVNVKEMKTNQEIRKDVLSEVEKMIDTELNNCDKYIPKEDNHNFNRNTILGVTKNTLLLLKQNLKTLKEKKQ